MKKVEREFVVELNIVAFKVDEYRELKQIDPDLRLYFVPKWWASKEFLPSLTGFFIGKVIKETEKAALVEVYERNKGTLEETKKKPINYVGDWWIPKSLLRDVTNEI